jgi:hypothetical protein
MRQRPTLCEVTLVNEAKMKLIKAEMDALMKSNGGMLLPEQVIAAARNPNSRMHGEFTWDPKEGHEKLLLQEARALIRRIEFTVTVDSKPVERKAYVSVRMPASVQEQTGTQGPTRGYQGVVTVMSDTDKKLSAVVAALQRSRTILANVPSRETDDVVARIDKHLRKLLPSSKVA